MFQLIYRRLSWKYLIWLISDKGYINQKVKNKLKRTVNIGLIYPYRGKKVLKSIKILILFGFKTHMCFKSLCDLKYINLLDLYTL